MPFNDTIGSYLALARRRMKESPRAFDIFHQTLGVSDSLLEYLKAESGYPFVDSKAVSLLLQIPEKEREGLINDFYKALGFESWSCVDSHKRPHGVIMDFNLNLREKYNYRETYDLIVNNGSTEHLFDQKTTFENIHNLCKSGGLMLHKIPTLEILNIALYGCGPAFFVDLAVANKYEVLDLRLANRWGDMVRVRLPESELSPEPEFIPVHRSQFVVKPKKSVLPWRNPGHETLSLEPISFEDFTTKSHLKNLAHPLSRACNALMELGARRRPDNPGEIFTLGLYRKVHDVPFHVPFQGKYLADIQTEEFRERYKNQFEPNPLFKLKPKK